MRVQQKYVGEETDQGKIIWDQAIIWNRKG